MQGATNPLYIVVPQKYLYSRVSANRRALQPSIRYENYDSLSPVR